VILRIDVLRNALRRWSQDTALVQTLRVGWAIDLPSEVFVAALATGRGLAINVSSHKVLLQLRHGSQHFEFALPIAALTDAAVFEKWLRAIRTRAEQRLDYEHVSSNLHDRPSDHPDLPADHWQPIDDPCRSAMD
jgi:hypothetical protein